MSVLDQQQNNMADITDRLWLPTTPTATMVTPRICNVITFDAISMARKLAERFLRATAVRSAVVYSLGVHFGSVLNE